MVYSYSLRFLDKRHYFIAKVYSQTNIKILSSIFFSISDFFIFPSPPELSPLFDENGTLFSLNITGFSNHESYLVIKNITLIFKRPYKPSLEYATVMQIETLKKNQSSSYLNAQSFYWIQLPVNVSDHGLIVNFFIEYEFQGTLRGGSILSANNSLDFYRTFAGISKFIEEPLYFESKNVLLI